MTLGETVAVGINAARVVGVEVIDSRPVFSNSGDGC